jgi:hypothetical protein
MLTPVANKRSREYVIETISRIPLCVVVTVRIDIECHRRFRMSEPIADDFDGHIGAMQRQCRGRMPHAVRVGSSTPAAFSTRLKCTVMIA